jgi:hypothetical protein
MIEHKRHLDLQGQEEKHDLEIDDYFHTFHYGESESHILGSPSIYRVVDIDI